MVTLAQLRESYGALPAYAWPGAYPVAYYTGNGLMVCHVCADEPDTSDPAVAYDMYMEGPAVRCEDCGRWIASAYGPVEDSEQEDPAYARFVADAQYRADAWHRQLRASVARIGGWLAIGEAVHAADMAPYSAYQLRREAEDWYDWRVGVHVARDTHGRDTVDA